MSTAFFKDGLIVGRYQRPSRTLSRTSIVMIAGLSVSFTSVSAQLKAKKYAAIYLAVGQPFYLIAVEFSKEARNLVAFEVKSVAGVSADAVA
jgi:hypothetical protein